MPLHRLATTQTRNLEAPQDSQTHTRAPCPTIKQRQRRLTRAPNRRRKYKPDEPPPEPVLKFKIDSLRLDRFHCTRCHHTWIPRQFKLPKVCPHCKSLNWHIPYGLKRGNQYKQRTRKPTGRKRNEALSCEVCARLYRERGTFSAPPMTQAGDKLPPGYELIDHTK